MCERGKGENRSKGSGQHHRFRVAVTNGEAEGVREEGEALSNTLAPVHFKPRDKRRESTI